MLDYFGKVKITCDDTVYGDNHGTINLCEFLRDSLVGKAVPADRPATLVPCSIYDNVLVDLYSPGHICYETELGNILVNSEGGWDIRREGNIDGSYIKLKFRVNNIYKSIPSYDGSKRYIEGFRLYKQSGYEDSHVMAEIVMKTPIEVKKKTSLDVEWYMCIRTTGD